MQVGMRPVLNNYTNPTNLTNRFTFLTTNELEQKQQIQQNQQKQQKQNVYHPNQKIIHKTVLGDDGFYSTTSILSTRNIHKNLTATPITMQGDVNSIRINIKGINILMCKDYYTYETTPIEQRSQKPVCTHPYNDLAHQHLPLCFFYTKRNCKKGDQCNRYHADNPNTLISQNIPKQHNYKTSLCLIRLHNQYNKNYNDCQITNCKHAHTINSLNNNSILEQFDKDIKINPNKNLLQEIYNEIYIVVNTNKDDICKLYLKNDKDKPYFSDPIPSNFSEYLEILSYSLYLSSKDNNIELYNKLNIKHINYVQGLLRRMKQCKTDLNLHLKLALGQNGLIKKDDICIHYKSCNSGIHLPLSDNLMHNTNISATMICKNELEGNCICQNQDNALIKHKLNTQINDLINDEKTLIEQLKFNSLSIDEYRLKIIKQTKEKKILDLLTTIDKIHLIKDFGYNPIQQVNLEPENINKEFDETNYNEIDTKSMTRKELEEYLHKQQIRHDNLSNISKQYANELKQKKEKQEQETIELYNKSHEFFENNKMDEHVSMWFTTNGWKYFPFNEYMINRDIFTNWLKNPLGCDYARFKQFVNKQNEKWEHIDDNMKARYHTLWSYIYNITIENDTNIIGDLKDIIDSSPEIWCEYTNKYSITNYSKTFTEYINENEMLARALKVNKMFPEFGYNKALKYIRLDINNMTFKDYCTYDNHTVVMWNEINNICKKYQMSQYKIDDFITNKTNLIEFYKYGIKYYGTTQESFNRFIQEKADGWKINIKPAKINEYSSLLALSLDQLKEFFQKNNVWSIEMMTKFRTYVPSIVYTINNKAQMYTVFTSIIDNQIKELYKLIISPEITKILNNNGEINKANTDIIALIKLLLNEINNSQDVLTKLCDTYKDRASELRLLKTTFDPNSELLVLANKVLDIFKNIKGKRELTNLKIKKIIKKDDSEQESDDSDSDDSEQDSDSDDSEQDSDSDSDSDSDDSEQDNSIDITTKDNKPKDLYELMSLGYDYKIYIMNEHPNALPIDKTSSGRKIYFGPFIDTELNKDIDTNKSWIKDIIKILQESKFGKGSHLGAKFLKLEDPKNNKLPSWHIVLNDKKITSKSNKYKDKCERQDKMEDEYGYDWVADLFINIINKKLNYRIDQVLTNIFTLEARMKDHINRNNRTGIAKVVKHIIKEKEKTKPVLTKEEKTQIIRDKLAAKSAGKK